MRCHIRQTRSHLALHCGIVVGLLTVAGCSAWKDTTPEAFELPVTRMSPDSVALEITFVRVPVGEAEFNLQLWQQVDEQRVTVEKRLHLNNNGFRCGFVAQLPTILRELLDQQQEQATRLDQSVTSEMDVLAQNRRVQSRAGQRTEIVTSSPREEMVVLHKDQADDKVVGKSFRDAESYSRRPVVSSG